MNRWEGIDEQEIFDMTVKMYRDPYEPDNSFEVEHINVELDFYAFQQLGSELLMYRILDSNFEQYIEERGDLERLSDITVPISQDETETIY